MNGLVVELLLQPFAGKGFMGDDTMGLLFSALDGHEGKNLPAAVRFQVRHKLLLGRDALSWCLQLIGRWDCWPGGCAAGRTGGGGG